MRRLFADRLVLATGAIVILMSIVFAAKLLSLALIAAGAELPRYVLFV